MGGTGKAPATKIRSRSKTLFFRVLALLSARGANSRGGRWTLDAGRWTELESTCMQRGLWEEGVGATRLGNLEIWRLEWSPGPQCPARLAAALQIE